MIPPAYPHFQQTLFGAPWSKPTWLNDLKNIDLRSPKIQSVWSNIICIFRANLVQICQIVLDLSHQIRAISSTAWPNDLENICQDQTNLIRLLKPCKMHILFKFGPNLSKTFWHRVTTALNCENSKCQITKRPWKCRSRSTVEPSTKIKSGFKQVSRCIFCAYLGLFRAKQLQCNNCQIVKNSQSKMSKWNWNVG